MSEIFCFFLVGNLGTQGIVQEICAKIISFKPQEITFEYFKD